MPNSASTDRQAYYTDQELRYRLRELDLPCPREFRNRVSVRSAATLEGCPFLREPHAQANGVCTFGVSCLAVCGPFVRTVSVPVGETRIVQRGNLPRIDVTQYTLHQP